MNKKVITTGLLVIFIGILAAVSAGCSSPSTQSIGKGQAVNNLTGVQGNVAGLGRVESPQPAAAAQDNGNLSVALQGNSSTGRPQGNSRGTGGGQGNGGYGAAGGSGGPEAFGTLSEVEVDALLRAIEEEYGARALYESVVAAFGDVDLFTRIVRSETQHAAVLIRLAEKYGVETPEYPGVVALPAFDTLEEACQAGVQAEIADADLYDELMVLTDKPDMLRVFENLRQASLESHLQAFQACE